VAAEEEVDAGVGYGEYRSEGCGHAFEALHGAVVVEDTGLDVGDAAGLAVADQILHLGFQYGQVGEDLCFEFSHFF
jgi:hypothetical protein